MSPTAMAAFAFLPGRYRGRVMVLNNLVAAAVGILLATIFVAVVSPMVDPLWLVYPMAALLVARIVLGVVLNRRYTALLSESIVSNNKLNLARLEENTTSFVRDEALLDRLALLVLALHSLNMPREDERRLAYTVCRELLERAAAVQHNTLEFIDAKVTGDARNYLITYYEQVTIEEKRGRLRALLRRSGDDLNAIVGRWLTALSAIGNATAVELYGILSP